MPYWYSNRPGSKSHELPIREFKQFGIDFQVRIQHGENHISSKVVTGFPSFPHGLVVDQLLVYLLQSPYVRCIDFGRRLVHLNHTFWGFVGGTPYNFASRLPADGHSARATHAKKSLPRDKS
jgi:hypothetical protein